MDGWVGGVNLHLLAMGTSLCLCNAHCPSASNCPSYCIVGLLFYYWYRNTERLWSFNTLLGSAF